MEKNDSKEKTGIYHGKGTIPTRGKPRTWKAKAADIAWAVLILGTILTSFYFAFTR